MNDNNNDWMEKVNGVEGPRDITPAPMLPTEALAKSAVTDATRVMSETQAMIMLARSNPRKYMDVSRNMKDVCSRVKFAEKSCYRFPRGQSEITGPSIRLMEAIVIAMTNIDAGWRVLDMEDTRARVEAFAWDVENNTRKRIEFWVPFSRDTKAGVFPVTSERDKYEVMASAAQRRVRACIQNIIPFDIIEDAMEMCSDTLRKGDGKVPLKDRISRMVLSFEEEGVSQAMIEANLGHPIEAIITNELPRMREIYNAIRDGHARREDFFDVSLTGGKKEVPKEPEKKPDGETNDLPPQDDNPKPKPEPEPNPDPDPTPDPNPKGKTMVVTKPAPESAANDTPQLCDILLNRLRNAHKMSDEQIKAALGGPIEGAPVEELERIIDECDKRLAAKGSKKNKQEGELNLTLDTSKDDSEF